jgi:hypothetical protein
MHSFGFLSYALYMRILFFLLLAAGISGCKIEIAMPAHGTVVSSTGLYGCAAGEICTLDIDDPWLDENFTAVPDTGYRFVRWVDQDNALCRGKKAVCENMSSLYHPQFPSLFALLSQDITYYLTPEFEPDGSQSPVDESDPVFVVESTYNTINYEIDGDSSSELFAAMNSSANPIYGAQKRAVLRAFEALLRAEVRASVVSAGREDSTAFEAPIKKADHKIGF